MKLSTSQKIVAIATGLAITMLEATAIQATVISVNEPSQITASSETIAATTTRKRKKKKKTVKKTGAYMKKPSSAMKKPVDNMQKPDDGAMKKPDGAAPDAVTGGGSADPQPTPSP